MNETTILESDVNWAYGIMLALRNHKELPQAILNQIEGFIDHFHKTYYSDDE